MFYYWGIVCSRVIECINFIVGCLYYLYYIVVCLAGLLYLL